MTGTAGTGLTVKGFAVVTILGATVVVGATGLTILGATVGLGAAVGFSVLAGAT